MDQEIGNGFVVREVSAAEYQKCLAPHFQEVFQNRVDDSRAVDIDDASREKISKRAQVQRFHLRLMIFKNENVVGWHQGYEKEPDTYYMQNSGVRPEYRNQGLYTKLLEIVLERIQNEGFQVITSTHHPHNTAVLIPKLRRGFFITGVHLHERFRSLIELKYIYNEDRRKNYFKSLGLEL